MDYLQRVLWTEGLFLTPHHLQQMDRYHEHRVNMAVRNVQPMYYGLVDVRIDEAALADGNFLLHRCKGVLPAGILFDIPEFDEIPPARDLSRFFGPEKESLGVYVGVPIARAGFQAAGGESSKEGIPPRFKSKDARIIDSMGLAGDRMVTVALSNLRVLLEGESLDGHTQMKIAEVVRTPTGAFALSQTYVPPCLHIQASVMIRNMLRHLLEILSTRSADLARQRRQRAEGLVDFTMSEAANFWLLHTMNGALPALLHAFNFGKIHPETLYGHLAFLAGQLFTFAAEGHPKDIPPYVHEDLTRTFGEMRALLDRLLETVIPTHCIPIPLERTPEGHFVGRMGDEKLLKGGRFFLAVKSSAPDERIAVEIPRKAKITSANRIAGLTAQFLRGLDVTYRPVPPKLIPVQPGCHYFEFGKEGEHWAAIEGSGSIALHVPPEFPDLHLELMVVKE